MMVADSSARCRSSARLVGDWCCSDCGGGYESPRHVYLASAGWAIVVAFVLNVEKAAPPAARRRLVTVGGVLLLACYGLRLHAVIDQWHTMAAVSHKVVSDVRTEALIGPAGSL